MTGMSIKKLLNRTRRGGRRENAGRKSNWKNQDTITIRVPRAIVSRVIELAHRIDSGESIELDTQSKNLDNEIITQSNEEREKLKSDFVTKSILSYSQAIEIAKQILLSKKSARISIAKIISEIYQQNLSPEDLKS